MPPTSLLPLSLAALAGAVIGCAGSGRETAAVQTGRCEPVHRFLTEGFAMVAETLPDTIDDWRTQKKVPGCRVIAAGGTAVGMERQTGLLYQQLQGAGWTRTPEPRDAPNEGALRMRLSETDCFFTPYSGIVIGDPAEMRVNGLYQHRSDEAHYNVLVQCMPAMEAAP